MAVSYKKLSHLLIDKGMTNAELMEKAGFSANIVTVKPSGGLLECSWCEKISP